MTDSPARDPRIPDLVSLRQAADMLGISKQAAHKRAMRGQLKGAQVDGAWLFRREVVTAAAGSAELETGKPS